MKHRIRKIEKAVRSTGGTYPDLTIEVTQEGGKYLVDGEEIDQGEFGRRYPGYFDHIENINVEILK